MRVGLLVLCLCLLGFAPASQYDRWITGIKLLVNDERSGCTAFRIGVDKWMSAAHCVASVHVIGGYEAVLVKVDMAVDLALFRLVAEEQPLGFIFPIATKTPEIGDATVTVGHSGNATKPVTFFGPVMGGSYKALLGAKELLLVQSMGASIGSGSPILVDGKVVSLMAGGVNLSTQGGSKLVGAIFNYGPTLKQLRAFLGLK